MFKPIPYLFSAFFLAFVVLTACNSEDTYADLREKENKQIAAFLKKGCTVRHPEFTYDFLKVDPNIKVISEQQFYDNDSTTDVTKNEYVLFAGSGVYMQILRKGTGKKIAKGETTSVICRFTEFNIAADSLSLTNIGGSFEQWSDVMTVTNTSGTFTASFLSGMMKRIYKTTSVPSGWLMPFPFLNIGRQSSSAGEVAKVRLIVPSTQGQADAYDRVYPCFYEITYTRGR